MSRPDLTIFSSSSVCGLHAAPSSASIIWPPAASFHLLHTAKHVNGAFKGWLDRSGPVVHHCIHAVLTSSSEISSMCAGSLSSTLSSCSWFDFVNKVSSFLELWNLQKYNQQAAVVVYFNLTMQRCNKDTAYQLILEIPEEKTARGAFVATRPSMMAATTGNVTNLPPNLLYSPFMWY